MGVIKLLYLRVIYTYIVCIYYIYIVLLPNLITLITPPFKKGWKGRKKGGKGVDT